MGNFQHHAVQGAVQGVVQSPAAKSGKGAVQAAAQGALQGAVHYCTCAAESSAISKTNSNGIRKASLKPFHLGSMPVSFYVMLKTWLPVK